MSIYRFGPFEARTSTEELFKFGTKVSLRGQPFQILRTLLDRPGEVVTREQMRHQLWPSDTFVDFEHGINTSLRKLRLTLGDSAVKPLYIETLPGQGYRFIAPLGVVKESAAAAGDAAPVPGLAEERNAEKEERENQDRAEFAANSGLAWRKGVLLGLAVGLVGCGLLFIAAKGARRIVGGVAAKTPDAAVATGSDPSAAERETSPHRGAAAPGSGNASRRAWPAQAASPIHGKVWVVSADQASHVAFPPPSATPDATFITRGIAYVGTAPKNCYTLVTFLTECGIGGFDLKFSGIANANLGGAAAGPTTAMSGNGWGILVEFTGTTEFSSGQEIVILHDDGVALEIDGKHIPGFSPGPTTPALESEVFTGSSGVHSFDLLYANAAGGGAWLLFYPALF
jgi:DNA-binding winged helix-turn-helix (wHTH) protein